MFTDEKKGQLAERKQERRRKAELRVLVME